MNLVARFESFIERLMERTFTRATRSHLQPVEIGKRLIRSMEAQQSVGVEGVLVPNVYDVFLSRHDFDEYKQARVSMARNLESHLARVARQRHFQMMSRPVVRLCDDAALAAGDIRIEPHMEDVEPQGNGQFQHTSVLPPVDTPVSSRPATPNLVVDGHMYAVLRTPTRVGRMPDNDIVLNDKRVSRHHAEVAQSGNRWILRDTGSTNGTALNGKVVKEGILKPGDTISLGGLEAVWEQ